MTQFNLRLNHWKQIPYSLGKQSLIFIIHIIVFLSVTRGHTRQFLTTHSNNLLACLLPSHLSLLHTPFPCCHSMPFHVHHFNIVLQKYNVSRGFLQLLGQVSYGDIDHWMWRLYLDDFGEFCDSIGLPVCPYAELRPDDPLPPPTTLLYGISPRVIEKPQYWPER